jgi:hypothetical protein
MLGIYDMRFLLGFNGADIDGEAAGDQVWSSVSLSSDGNLVAIAAPYNDGMNQRYIRIL